jgi:hypothetical protein
VFAPTICPITPALSVPASVKTSQTPLRATTISIIPSFAVFSSHAIPPKASSSAALAAAVLGSDSCKFEETAGNAEVARVRFLGY